MEVLDVVIFKAGFYMGVYANVQIVLVCYLLFYDLLLVDLLLLKLVLINLLSEFIFIFIKCYCFGLILKCLIVNLYLTFFGFKN